MKEPFFERLRRIIKEKRIKRLNRIIQKAVRKKDKLSNFAFMAYSWGADDVTDYHIFAERSYTDVHVYGLSVDHYDHEQTPLRCEKCSFYLNGQCNNLHKNDDIQKDDYCSKGAWTGGVL